jgi:hypothetical protein
MASIKTAIDFFINFLICAVKSNNALVSEFVYEAPFITWMHYRAVKLLYDRLPPYS